MIRREKERKKREEREKEEMEKEAKKRKEREAYEKALRDYKELLKEKIVDTKARVQIMSFVACQC